MISPEDLVVFILAVGVVVSFVVVLRWFMRRAEAETAAAPSHPSDVEAASRTHGHEA